MIALRYIVLFFILLLPSVKAHAGYTTLYDSRCYPDMATASLAFSGANLKFENGHMTWVNIASVTPTIIYFVYTSYDMATGQVLIQRSDSTPLLACSAPLEGSAQFYEAKITESMASMVAAASAIQAATPSTKYPADKIAMIVACCIMFGIGYSGGRTL